MGKLSNGILGNVTGKVGGVVGRSWKGINTLAAYQPSVTNPDSNAQRAQRGKMSAIVVFASAILTSMIKPLWDRFAKQMSGYNAFVQKNIDVVDSEGYVEYADIIISEGRLAAPFMSAGTMSGANVVVNWSTVITDSYGLATDKVYILIRNDSTGALVASSGIVARSAGTATVACTWAAPANCIVWVAFRRADGTMVSTSSNTQYSA